jgi:hypothetical protein
LHDDSDSFSEISQDSDIYIIEHSDPHTEINEPDLSDSGGNSDDAQACTNVVDDGGGGGGDDNDEDDDTNDDWALWDENDHDFCKIPFRASSGKKTPRNGQMPVSACEFFRQFFSATLFDEIAAETNRYVCEKINKAMPLKKHSIWVRWEDVTTEELMAFHGVILNMARHVKSSVTDFFSEQWLDSSWFYKDIFSRKGFLQLYWGLHVSPRPGAETPDRQMQSRASKVKNVIDYVQSKFLEFYSPTQYLSADGSTVNFKGHVVFKMYNPQNPTKWRLRIYVIVDSINEYVCGLITSYGSIIAKKFDASRAIIYQQNCSRTHKQGIKRNTLKRISSVHRQVLY